MDAILVVNAGSSSVKFQIFGIEGGGALSRLVKGQIDGIGTRPRLLAKAHDGSSLIDRSYASNEVPDVPAAIAVVAAWLRETQSFNLVAVGHRVVHGGPKYDRPVVIDQGVVASLEQYISLAPLHQPNNLAPIRALLMGRPELLQVACFDTAFHHGHSCGCGPLCHSGALLRRGCPAIRFPRSVLRIHRRALARGRPKRGGGPSHRRASRQRRVHVRCCQTAAASKARWVSPRSTGYRWARGRARSIPGYCSTCSPKRAWSPSAIQDLLYRDSGLQRPVRHQQRHARAAIESRSPRDARRRPFRLPHRVECRDAGGRAGRARCIRVHRRRWRELASDPRAHRGKACMARRRFDPEANANGNSRISGADSRVALMVVPTDEELMIAQHTVALLSEQSGGGATGQRLAV